VDTGDVFSGKTLTGKEKISVTVEVTNTGAVAGKDVVELYVKAPYTGTIEKSSVVLAGFAKTDVIPAGGKATVTVTAEAVDFASFDQETAKTAYQGYVLEKGDYTLSLQSDSHTVKTTDDTLNYTLSADVQVGDSEAIFSKDDKYNSTMNGLTSMSRSDWEGTYPASPKGDELDLAKTATGEKIYQQSQEAFVASSGDAEKDEVWYDYYKSIYDSKKDVWTQDAETTIDFQEMVGVEKDDAKWDQFINQLSLTELKQLLNGQSYYTLGLEEYGIPEGSHGDGPCCIYNWHNRQQGTTWPAPFTVASSWNVELAEEQGKQVGNEGMWLDVDVWYAPATDGHRSPFAGRNFEYYSEDGVLAGNISGYVIRGAQSKGLNCQLKHFAVNEEEWNRQNLITWLDEQTLREVYTKSFRIAIEIGNPYGLMSSMNRIGLVGTDNNFNFLTVLLRQEFGFNGFVTSDMIMSMTTTSNVDNIDLFNRAGMDVALTLTYASTIGQDPPLTTGEWNKEGNYMTTNGERNDIAYAAIRTCAKNILFAVAQSNALDNGVSLDTFQGKALTGDVRADFSASVAADSEKLGTEIVKYVLADGSTLPDGLTLDSSTGVISGTPLAAGNYSFDITIVADGYIDKTETFTMTIGNGAFKVSDLKATAGTEFKGSISIDGVDSQSYTYVAGELPAGIRLLEDGTITGTAVTPGTYTFNVYAEVVTTEMCGAPWLMLPVEHDYVLEVTMTVAEAPADTTVTDLSNKVDAIASDVDDLKNAEKTTTSTAGCGSVIGVSGAAIGMVGILAAAIVATKKKQK
jgi:beta-glucosidase-like glycosyl hydrolase